MPSQAKIDLVAQAKQCLDQAKSTVIVDYRGLKVAEITDLRTRLREQGAQLRVIKNRLARIAMRQTGLPTPEGALSGPSAFALSLDDPAAGPRVVSEFARNNENLTIKCGLFAGGVLDPAAVETLARLPRRDVLLGHLSAALRSPAAKFAMVLKATVNQLATVLEALARKRQEEGAK